MDEKSHQGLLVVGEEKCLWTLELIKDIKLKIEKMMPLSLMSIRESST